MQGLCSIKCARSFCKLEGKANGLELTCCELAMSQEEGQEAAMARLAGLTYGKIDHIRAGKCGVQGVTSANAIHFRSCCTKKGMREPGQRPFFVEPVHRQRHPARREASSDAVTLPAPCPGQIRRCRLTARALRQDCKLVTCQLSLSPITTKRQRLQQEIAKRAAAC